MDKSFESTFLNETIRKMNSVMDNLTFVNRYWNLNNPVIQEELKAIKAWAIELNNILKNIIK